jgi:hypothetical protein
VGGSSSFSAFKIKRESAPQAPWESFCHTARIGQRFGEAVATSLFLKSKSFTTL